MESSGGSSGIALFDGSNFPMWKARILARLDALGVKEVVDLDQTPDLDLEDAGFKTHNAKANDTIMRFIADSHLDYVLGEKTAYGMMEKLSSTFARSSRTSRIYYRMKWEALRCDEHEPLRQFFSHLDAATREYVAVGGVVTEMDKVERLLIAMPERYRAVVAVLETMDDDHLTVQVYKSRLLADKLRSQIMDSSSGANDSQSAEVAFHASIKSKSQSVRRLATWFYLVLSGVAGHKRNVCPKKPKPKFKPKGQASTANHDSNQWEQPNDDTRPFSLFAACMSGGRLTNLRLSFTPAVPTTL